MLLGGAAAVLSLALIPAVEHRVGPAIISAKAVAGPGRTTLLFPPLGSVRADTHRVPLTVRVSLQSVDISAVGEEVGTKAGQLALVRTLEGDLRAMAKEVAIRSLLGALIFGALALAVVPRRRWPYIVAGGTGGLLVVGALLGTTAASFNVERFQEPRFTGALTRAPMVIAALGQGRVALPEVRSRYEGAAERLSNLMALLADPDQDPRQDSVAILHVSDIHSNPIGVEIARQLVRRFDVDAVLDTGDLTNFGVQVETRIAELVETFPVPYYFVAGNHDSAAVQTRLARSPNVTVVDQEVIEIGGVRILGWADPTYTNWDSLPPNEAAEVRRAEGERVAEVVAQSAPDVLAVHDSRISERSYGSVPLVLSGHYHRQISEEHEGTRLLAVGTTGASGFKSFTLEAEMDHEAQIVYLRGGEAIALDYVTFTGLGGEFQIQRTLLEPLERPVPMPAPTGDQ
jgi:predicted phosphodiesterase